MDHKSIEVVLSTQEDIPQKLDISVLRKYFHNRKRVLALLLVASLAIGILFGLVRGISTGTGTASAMVTFSFEGIEKGEDPNGAVFDITKMKAPIILEAALEESGITSITADELRNHIFFEAVVPSDIQERIATLQTIAEKDSSALEKILEINYYPSQYKLSLDIRSIKMSSSEGIALLTAIMNQYRIWFFDTYGGASALGGSIAAMNLTTYDYAEAVDILETQSNIVSNYLSKLQIEAPTFRSADTGFTFADLKSQLTILSDVDMSKLNSLILSTGLTRDKSSLDAYYTYQIQMANTERVKIQEQQQSVEAAIASYEKDSILIMGTDNNTQTTMNQSSGEYDSLFQQRIELDQLGATQQQRLTILQQRLDSLRKADSTQVSPEQLAAAAAKAEESIPLISTKLTELIRLTNDTADDYYETVAFKTAYQISLPAQIFSSGFMGVVKQVVLFSVGFLVLGTMACFGVVLVPPLVTGTLFKTAQPKNKRQDEQTED